MTGRDRQTDRQTEAHTGDERMRHKRDTLVTNCLRIRKISALVISFVLNVSRVGGRGRERLEGLHTGLSTMFDR